MGWASSLRGILRCAALPQATVSELDHLLARAGIHNRGPSRYITMREVGCPGGLPLPKSEAVGSEKKQEAASSQHIPKEPRYWILPWWWRSKAVWKHHDAKNAGRITVFEHMKKHTPIVSEYLYGETWLTDLTTRSGITFLSGLAELFEEMREKGVSFYDTLTADMIVMDEFGKPHIANGVLLQPFTRFSHSLGIIYGADAVEDLFSIWRKGVMVPDVLDFLELMRCPWLQPEFLMLIHYACLHEHQRAPSFMKVFECIIYGLDPLSLHKLLQYIQRRSLGWGYGVMQNMLLRQYFFNDQKNRYNPNNARDGLFIRRHGKCHVLGFLQKMVKYGFPYIWKDQQLLLHVKLGIFNSIVQRSLWHKLGEGGRKVLKRLKPEEFLCNIGICCPIGECMRTGAFERDARHRYEQSGEDIKAIIRVANMSRSRSLNETYIVQTPAWHKQWSPGSYFKPVVPRRYDRVFMDFHASDRSKLTVLAGAKVELVYEPENCYSELDLSDRFCYVRDTSNNFGFVDVKCLEKYAHLSS